MEVKNKVDYKKLKKNNKTGSGSDMIKYMEAWADTMEDQMTTNGKTVDEISFQCSLIASAVVNKRGIHISGEQMITSAQSLDKHWLHGGDVYASMRRTMGMNKEHQHVHGETDVHASIKAVTDNERN